MLRGFNREIIGRVRVAEEVQPSVVRTGVVKAKLKVLKLLEVRVVVHSAT